MVNRRSDRELINQSISLHLYQATRAHSR